MNVRQCITQKRMRWMYREKEWEWCSVSGGLPGRC